ncbi:divalent cation transporter [Palleronia sediminis]|uniref:Divalent cation transporter n=1 Tax=Palleronia sediminis TaxID=2547833 RepID=A0A4R6AJP8_9RHOB|nr:divalent cation transporter [Palleronia sediminis]TDL81966.1 divalent cation transporter [Palleronia sediminis]
MLLAILYSTLAGATIPLGGWLAMRGWPPARGARATEITHGVIAFGGGALVAAVAFVLVPDGAEKVPVWLALAAFAAGGVFFLWLDRRIARSGSQKSQLVAMLSDFIPEALALGALMASGGSRLLMALLIALQNLPEGFNAFREMEKGGGHDRGRTLKIFAALACLGPVAAVLGHVVLSDFDGVLGTVMLFAAGGILYLVFEDIAPQVRLERDFLPPLGAVGGFALGMAGHLILP